MPNITYKVVPAPAKGRRGPGAKGVDGRFAHAMEVLLNEMAADGWTYERAETLPSNDRSGMTRRVVETYQNVLVFSKVVEEAEVVAPTPEVAAPVIAPVAPLPVEPAVSAPEEVAEIEDVVEDAVEEATEETTEEERA